MLAYTPMKLEHLDELRPYITQRRSRNCDDTVADMFMWREWFHKTWVIVEKSLVVRMTSYDGKTAYMVPLGGPDASRSAALEAILEDCREQGEDAYFTALVEDDVKWLREAGELEVEEMNSGWWDYIYEADALVNLSGKKYSSQRNHINKFVRDYPMYSFEPIMEENLEAVKTFFNNFDDSYFKELPMLDEERKGIAEILDNFDLYQLPAGCLMLGDHVVGFTIGELIGDTLFSHIEKATTDLMGAYPILTHEFNDAMTAKYPQIRYINREEDMGDPGLQRSKEGYNPIFMLRKYQAKLKL